MQLQRAQAEKVSKTKSCCELRISHTSSQGYSMDYTVSDPKVPETDFRWERKPHPMCIPHIVDGILAYLSVPDLKSARLVSLQYNEIACKALQREETITFKNIPQLQTYLSNIKPISQTLLSKSSPRHYPASLFSSSDLSLCSVEQSDSSDGEFYGEKLGTDAEDDGGDCWPYFDNTLSYFESIGRDFCPNECQSQENEFIASCQYRYSHRSFHFDCCDPPEEIEEVEQFFSTFGPQIRRLKYTTDLLPYNFPRALGHMGEVWQDRLSNLEELILEIKWGVPATLFSNSDEDDPRRLRVMLRSLRRLHLDILLTDSDADRAEVFFQQLLAITPNIEEIEIPGAKRFFDDYINVVLARVILNSETLHLSVLNFCLALSDAQMRLLTEKNLPLSTLILDLEDLQFDNAVGNGEDGEGNNDDPQQQDNIDQFGAMQDEDLRLEFIRQNQNRRRSFTPILKSTLQRFFFSLALTLRSLHICFPQSPRHNLHTFTFLQEMSELRFLALGYFAGSSHILDQLPALKQLELWNVQFRDLQGQDKVVPDKYQGITSVISS